MRTEHQYSLVAKAPSLCLKLKAQSLCVATQDRVLAGNYIRSLQRMCLQENTPEQGITALFETLGHFNRYQDGREQS